MPTSIQPSFSAGEVTPELFGRPDQNLYHIGLAKAENMQVSTTGGIYNRAGLRYVGQCKYSSNASYPGNPPDDFAPGARLLPFKFSAEDNYVLEFGHKYVRFIRNDAYVLEESGRISSVSRGRNTRVTRTNHGLQTGDSVFSFYDGTDFDTSVQWGERWFKVRRVSGSQFELRDHADYDDQIDSTGWENPGNRLFFDKVYEVELPYAMGDLARLDYSQLNDVMTLVHVDYEPRELRRMDHDDWEVEVDDSILTNQEGDEKFVWVLDDENNYVRSYKFENGIIKRDQPFLDLSSPFSLGDGVWLGGLAVGDNVWIVNDNTNTLVAYSHSGGSLTRQSSRDVSLGSGSWLGGFAVGDNVWIVSDSTNTLVAYSHSGGSLTRQSSRDVSLGSGIWLGGFAVGDNVWIVNELTDTLVAYSHSGGSLTRQSSRDVSLGSGVWRGGFAVGDNVWIVNDSTDTLVAYSHSGGSLTRQSGDFSLGGGNWRGGFAVGDNVWIVNDSTNILVHYEIQEREGGDTALSNQTWTGCFAIGDNVWITEDNNNVYRKFISEGGYLRRGSASDDLRPGSGSWRGGFAVGDNVWIVNDSTDTLVAYSHSGGSLTRQSSRDVSLGSGSWLGGFAVGDNVWIVNDSTNTLVAYSHSGGSLTRQSGDFSLGTGNWQGGLAVGDNVWIVNDSTNTLVAYFRVGNALLKTGGVLALGSGNWWGSFATPKSTVLDEQELPGVTGYHQQRKIYAGSNKQPAVVRYSKTGVYDEFGDSGDLSAEDDPIETNLAAGEQNQIRYAVGLRDLLLLTDSTQWEVSSGSQGFSARTVQQRAQTRVGAAFIKPQIFDDHAVYVREGQKEIIGVGYSEQQGGFVPVELSLLSRHLFEDDPCVDISAALTPEKRLACVTREGNCAFLTFNPQQKVTAWTSWNTAGQFESVQGARANLEAGAEDVHYFVVKREINGKTVRYVERMDDRRFKGISEAYFVDCGLSYGFETGQSGNVREIGGLWHLEGEDVDVLADGESEGTTVRNGKIILNSRSSKVHIGLPYVSTMETLPLDRYPRETDITDQGKIRFIPYLLVNVRKSLNVKAAPTPDPHIAMDASDGDFVVLKMRSRDGKNVDLEYDNRGLLCRAGFKGGWNPSQALVLKQEGPMPMNVLSVIPVFDTEDDR